MIKGEKVLGLITARGGSKGVPGKNVRPVGGVPLIAWTIRAGAASKYIDRLILSSDDDEIIDISKKYGCESPFKRAPELSRDETHSIDVVLDALDRVAGYDWVILLQPTSPLRNASDIDESLEKCLELNAPACVSVCEASENPFWMFFQENSRIRKVVDAPPIARRQDLPKVYILNGAVYVAKTSWLRDTRSFLSKDTIAHEMPRSRSVDIDVMEDFATVELIVKNKSGQIE
jgi:CMP-N,N'-diacetyllegionaminic acid synthase